MDQFDTKEDAREAVWTELREQKAARFPFPVKGRIPNFDGAAEAAEALFDHEIWRGVSHIKCNPDSPQKHVRRMALERGITVFVPTPRLRGGFKRLDPARIPEESYRDASMLSRMDDWVEPVELDELPQMDLIVTGCVAVTRDGRRCGKGEGYSDLEAAILLELGHDPVPVVTTVHDLQVVEGFSTDEHDVRLSVIATPTAVIETGAGPSETRLDWSRIDDAMCDEMPVLGELRAPRS
jgi:5-formyltetrahydrofolate cyclo-ligase